MNDDEQDLATLAPYRSDDLNPETQARWLDHTDWSNDFSWDHLRQLADYTHLYEIPTQTEIFNEGSPTSYLGIIVEGDILILKDSHESPQLLITQLRPGQVIGEIAFIDNFPRSATAKTGRAVKMLALSRHAFEQLCDDYPRLAVKLMQKIMRCVSMRLRDTSGKLVEYLSF